MLKSSNALRIAALAILAWLAPQAQAQTFPSRQVKIISGVGVGGTFDIFIRALGEELSRKWRQPVVIEPRPGGNFITASRACADAEPDGHTLCSLSGDNIVFPEFIVRDLGFDLRGGLKPVVNLFYNPQMLVVTAQLGARTLDEVAVAAKKRQGTLAFMAPAPTSRLFLEEFNQKHGLDVVNVPFRGGSDALSNLLSGAIHFVFTGAANFGPLIQDGRIHPLVVDSAQRLTAYPSVPTMREAGYAGPMVRNYLGLVAPGKMTDALARQINADVNAAMNESTFRTRHLVERGLIPANGSVEDFAAYIAQDRIDSAAVAKAAKMVQN